jgi:hypothetical protein
VGLAKGEAGAFHTFVFVPKSDGTVGQIRRPAVILVPPKRGRPVRVKVPVRIQDAFGDGFECRVHCVVSTVCWAITIIVLHSWRPNKLCEARDGPSHTSDNGGSQNVSGVIGFNAPICRTNLGVEPQAEAQ